MLFAPKCLLLTLSNSCKSYPNQICWVYFKTVSILSWRLRVFFEYMILSSVNFFFPSGFKHFDLSYSNSNLLLWLFLLLSVFLIMVKEGLTSFQVYVRAWMCSSNSHLLFYILSTPGENTNSTHRICNLMCR